MINLNCTNTKIKRTITLVLLMLTIGAVLYPAQARREVDQQPVVHDPNNQATGFAWEIHVRPENDAIVVTKDMWLVNQNEQKIPNTTYTYDITCEKHLGLNGGDVTVNGNVINFAGGYLECEEDIPSHIADFQQRIADWGTIACDTSCTIATEDLFIRAVLKPDGPTGQLLDYPAINNGHFFVVAGQTRLGWGLPVTSASSRSSGVSKTVSTSSLSPIVYASIEWGDRLKHLYMRPYCPITAKSNCEIHYQLGGGGVQVLDTGYATTYSYSIQENTFFIGKGGSWGNDLFTNFLGDVRYLRFDPPSCGGCFYPN